MGAVLAVYCQYFRSLVVGLMLKSYNAIANLCGFLDKLERMERALDPVHSSNYVFYIY